VIEFHIEGLRELNGRFASMRDGELVAIQLEEAKTAAATLQEIYRRWAPKSRKVSQAEGHTHFAEGLTAEAAATDVGFEIHISTSDPLLRKWLAEGTAAHEINPRHPMEALFWPQAAHPYARVHHPGTRPNPWEEMARLEAESLAHEVGRRIGQRVAAFIAGV
jgi:hypothetical protein